MVGKHFISFYGKIWNMAKKLIWLDVPVPETLNIYSFSLNTCTCTYNKWSLFLKHCTELTFTNLLFFLLFGTYTQLTDICVIQVTFHIPVIYQSIFLMRCTHKLLCIAFETSTFYFFYARHSQRTSSTCVWGPSEPEDLFISQDTCTIERLFCI